MKNKKISQKGFTQAPLFTNENVRNGKIVAPNKVIAKTQSAKSGAGFTLIEILVVIGLIAILAAVVIIAINPGRQFAQGRNSQRVSNVNAILNAIGQNIADNKGSFTCPVNGFGTNAIDATVADISSTSTKADIMPCIVPLYMSSVLVDPVTGSGNSTTTYVSGYQVSKDGNGRYTVSAPYIEPSIGGNAISVTR
jgi:type IV pilus assembly protein PilA